MLKNFKELLQDADMSSVASAYYDIYVTTSPEYSSDMFLQDRAEVEKSLVIAFNNIKRQSAAMSIEETHGSIIVVPKMPELLEDMITEHNEVLSFETKAIDELRNYIATTPQISSLEEYRALKSRKSPEISSFTLYPITILPSYIQLGFDVLVFDDYSLEEFNCCIAALLYEISFFGWDLEEADADKKNLLSKLGLSQYDEYTGIKQLVGLAALENANHIIGEQKTQETILPILRFNSMRELGERIIAELSK